MVPDLSINVLFEIFLIFVEAKLYDLCRNDFVLQPVNSNQYSSNVAVVKHYLTRLRSCESGRAGDEEEWVRSNSVSISHKNVKYIVQSRKT